MNRLSKKVYFKTVGCKVNQYETGALKQAFLSNGYETVEPGKNADVYIINTCAVTNEAERKSKQMIRKAARLNPHAIIVATGCAVQSSLPEIEECTNVTLIAGNNYKEDIFNILKQTGLIADKPNIFYSLPEEITEYQENNYFSATNRLRKLIKIQDGCNQFCSYCIIPYLRGRGRSRFADNIISEVKYLANRGCKEVVLLGINLGSYGVDLNGTKMSLIELIENINSIDNIERIRLSSIEPQYINRELVEAFQHFPKLCHHLHIPLQSGDNRILSLMNRKYTVEQYIRMIEYLKDKISDIAITTDIIVGFPGENDSAFNNTINVAERCSFSKIHVFPYSVRKFTISSFFPDRIEDGIIKNRSRQLIDLSDQLANSFIMKNVGKEKYVLIESQKLINERHCADGFTDNYIKVSLNNGIVNKGQMVKVKILSAENGYAMGKIE